MSTRKKVTIAGAGNTGGEMAQRLAEKNSCDVILKDEPGIVETLHHGKALDSAQSGAWAGFESQIIPVDTWEETADSDVIVVTAGAARKPGMTREDLLNINAKIMRLVAGPSAEHSPNAPMIIFANPMDVMFPVAMDATGFPR